MPSSRSRPLRTLLLVLAMLGSAPLGAQEGDYALKAAFLYNFALYTDWPETPARYRFCVVGQNPFDDALQGLSRKEIGGRPILVRTLQPGNDGLDENASQCDLAFIAASEHARLPRIVAAFAGRPVVTVAEEGSYDKRLVMLRLGYEQGRLVFDANQSAARAARLSFSARLLRLARQVF